MGGLWGVGEEGGGGLRLHRGAVVTLQRCRCSRSRCCSNPSTQTAPCSRQHSSPCDLHLWKTYGHSALPAEPGGQSCRVAYVTQTSQTPGGDERQSGSFARSTLSARLTPVFHVEVRPRWPWETTAPRETVAERPRARRPRWLKPDQSHGSSFSPKPLPWLGFAWPLKL